MSPADSVKLIIEGLQSESHDFAWAAFLSAYSDLIYGVIRSFARNADHAGDCYLFVCTKLADKNYRRLLSFRPDGRARFGTWLRAVVRNLCLDWYRSEFGRSQAFGSIRSLSVIDQKLFWAIFHRRMTAQSAWYELSQSYPDVTFSDVEQRIAKLRNLMTPRQLWLVSTSNAPIESIDIDSQDCGALEIPDPAPSPETISLLYENSLLVAKALQDLEYGDRLLLKLRFMEGLGLFEIAGLVGLKDAQTAHRRIREVIEKVREKLGMSIPVRGKQNSASV